MNDEILVVCGELRHLHPHDELVSQDSISENVISLSSWEFHSHPNHPFRVVQFQVPILQQELTNFTYSHFRLSLDLELSSLETSEPRSHH